jgi:simple sugar transport system permease protein
LFNIGAEGQLYIGAFAAALVGYRFTGLPHIIHVPLAILAAAVAAGIWSGIPGYLKARFGVHEVINTIMMNYIAYSLTSYLVMYPFKAPGAIPKTPDVLPTAQLYRFMEYSRLNTGVILALISLYVVYYLLWKTNLGYEIRAVGQNLHAAEYGGINIRKNMVISMFISGMFAGLAGAERVMGLHLSFIHGFSPGYGFEGIAVALLGRNHPVGILLSAVLFGALANGGLYMDMAADVPIDLVTVLQAIIIFFVAAEGITGFVIKRQGKGDKRNEPAGKDI